MTTSEMRMRQAWIAIATGRVKIAFRCSHCGSASLYSDWSSVHDQHEEQWNLPNSSAVVLTCVQCGHPTTARQAHEQRRGDVLAYIKQAGEAKDDHEDRHRVHER